MIKEQLIFRFAAVLALPAMCVLAGTITSIPRPSQRPPGDVPQIELRLSISKSAFRLGDNPPVLRVELHNHSSKDFYSTSLLEPEVTAPAYLLLEGTNSKGERFRLWQLSASGVISRWWNQIEPSHFYGTEYELNPDEFSFLKTPDLYHLSAIYVSGGGSTPPNAEWNTPSNTIWKGKITSNEVSIQVNR